MICTQVSTESSDSGDPWGSRPGFVTFVWNCDYRYIYGQTEQISTPCSSFQTYDIEITVDDSTVTFRDAAGACGDLSLLETIGTSGPLYVYVGADCDGCDAIWYSVEICSGLARPVTSAPSPYSTAARCSDILYSGTVWGQTAYGVALGAYTNNELQFIGCIDGYYGASCATSDFSCTDTDTGIAFGSTYPYPDSYSTMRSCHGVSSISECVTYTYCYEAGGLCNAPYTQTDATALCGQLGYQSGSVAAVTDNYCPETHWDGTTWTSDYVTSEGYGNYYTCWGSTAPGYAPTPLPTITTYEPTTLSPTKHPTYEPSRAPSARPTVAPTACRDALTTAVCAGYVSIEASACDSLFCAGIACAYSHMCDATCGLCYMAAEPVPAPTAAPMRASGAPSAWPSPAPSAPTALPTFGRTGVVQIILAPHDRDASVIRVYVELSADLGRFESIMLTLGDGAALVQVQAVDDGGTWFQLAAPTRAGWFGEPPRAPGHTATSVRGTPVA